MTWLTHYRGHLHSGKFDESMLLNEVTLEEYLAFQFPPLLLEKFPEQAETERDIERADVLEATLPGDGLWLWRWVDWSKVVDGAPFERGGLAVRRAGKVARVWLVWEGY
jgi:hypothetical protein